MFVLSVAGFQRVLADYVEYWMNTPGAILMLHRKRQRRIETLDESLTACWSKPRPYRFITF